MKRTLVLAAGLLVSCGCSTMNNTEAGAVTGGALGAGVGALAGAAVRAPLVGALVGGTVGALAGGAAGNAQDRAEDRAAKQVAAAQAIAAQPPPPPYPSLDEVYDMAKRNVGDTVIINAIRQSPGPYILAPNQIVWLREHGVSEAVISEMQAHGPQAVPQQRGVYVIQDPPPPPPVRVGVGLSYGGYYGRRW